MKGSKSTTTTKVIVKNVPFEATKKDIRDLFGYVRVLCLLTGTNGCLDKHADT